MFSRPVFLEPDPLPRLGVQLSAQLHRLKVARAAHNLDVQASALVAIDAILDRWIEIRASR